ncbi:MAG: hypothetical protein GF333_03565 [Candidatus Omnitrophica bacterium]|jgi:hypothetical protein|nr:hypothetical protein [Candidatus Omnitrophota bacterium]
MEKENKKLLKSLVFLTVSFAVVFLLNTAASLYAKTMKPVYAAGQCGLAFFGFLLVAYSLIRVLKKENKNTSLV